MAYKIQTRCNSKDYSGFLNYSLFAYEQEISLEDVSLIGYDKVKQN